MVNTFLLMVDKDRKGPRPGWKGDEVEDAPAGTAEEAAERAEGNRPVRADAEAKRAHQPEPAEDEPADGRRRTPSGEAPDEKTAEAAESHQEAGAPRSPHGKL
jgi:hypothetical protein